MRRLAGRVGLSQCADDVAPRTVLRWLLLLALPALVWPLLAWLHGPPRVGGALALHDARFVADAAQRPPEHDAQGEPRTLPDDWRRAARGLHAGWYELPFSVARADDAPWAVYLPALAMNADVWLDGELVGDGDHARTIARQWRRPLMWTLPAGIAAGAHRLQIRLESDLPDAGLLDHVYVGRLAVLAPVFARRHALEVEAVWVITLCLVLVGVFTGALWAQWRDPTYGWFAAAALAWAALHANLLVVHPPAGTLTWWGLWYVALVAWVVALARFVLAFVGLADPRPVRALTALGAVGVIALVPLVAVQSPWLHLAARAWVTAALPVLAFAAMRTLAMLRAAPRDSTVVVPCVLGLTVVGCALHDWLVFLGLAGPTYDYFLGYAALPAFLGMGWAIVRRFTGALEENAALVADLERRVAAKRAELERSYERLQVVERARVLADERERIMREMHDGLGSHLVSTLALLETDDVPPRAVDAAVRAALADLRLMIDALVPLDGDLLGALALVRARVQPQLEAAGIRVEWQVSDLARMPDLGPPQVLQILRVLQEALTNVVKHAAARTITVRTAEDADGVVVTIADDGRGLGATVRPGRGLHHMRQRAAAIGARLDLESEDRGTRVRLRLPRPARAVA
jgi:signal transduction histidine kinase